MLTTLHLGIVIVTGLLVLYSDEQALAWVLGKKAQLDGKRIAFLHTIISVGLGALLITGGLLYLRAVPAYLSDTTFIVKLVAIAALILNTYVIERFSHVAISRPFAAVSHRERIPLFISGGISVAGWATAIVCGLLLS